MNTSYSEFKVWWLEKQISWLKERTEYLFLCVGEEDDMEYIMEMCKEMIKVKKELRMLKEGSNYE